MRTVTLYRDDSTVQVVYERVKAVFWTAGNTVLVISRYDGEGPDHHYIHWPRERFCWFKDQPEREQLWSAMGDLKDILAIEAEARRLERERIKDALKKECAGFAQLEMEERERDPKGEGKQFNRYFGVVHFLDDLIEDFDGWLEDQRP